MEDIKNISIQDLKILLDYTKMKLEKKEGSKITKPDDYYDALSDYNMVMYNFEMLCRDILDELEKQRNQ